MSHFVLQVEVKLRVHDTDVFEHELTSQCSTDTEFVSCGVSGSFDPIKGTWKDTHNNRRIRSNFEDMMNFCKDKEN